MSRKPLALSRPTVAVAVAATAALALAACGSGTSASAANAATKTTAAELAGQSMPAVGSIPPSLQVPDGDDHKRVAVLEGTGVQTYTCVSGAWTLLEPAATLSDGSKTVALHSRGPVWVSTVDGSAVNAAAAATLPQKTAVAELLLKSTANRGTGVFSKVDYIQRLHTKGGLAPAGTCSSAGQLSVPYSATYVFYAPTS
jgi:hypothetical protein